MSEANDFLTHAGVKGMKWGVRKQSSPKYKASKSSKGSKWDKLATAMDLPGHRRAVDAVQKSRDRKIIVTSLLGSAALMAGANFVANRFGRNKDEVK